MWTAEITSRGEGRVRVSKEDRRHTTHVTPRTFTHTEPLASFPSRHLPVFFTDAIDSLDADSDVPSLPATARKKPVKKDWPVVASWRLMNDFARPRHRSVRPPSLTRPPDPRRASEWSPRSSPCFREPAYQESSTRAPERPNRRRDGRRAVARARRPGSVNSLDLSAAFRSVTQKSRSIREIHVEGWRRAWRRVSTSLEPWILPVLMRATPGMSRRPLSATHRDATRPTLLAVARKQTRATNLNLPRVFILRRTRLETRHPDSTARVESRAPHHGSPRNVTRD